MNMKKVFHCSPSVVTLSEKWVLCSLSTHAASRAVITSFRARLDPATIYIGGNEPKQSKHNCIISPVCELHQLILARHTSSWLMLRLGMTSAASLRHCEHLSSEMEAWR